MRSKFFPVMLIILLHTSAIKTFGAETGENLTGINQQLIQLIDAVMADEKTNVSTEVIGLIGNGANANIQTAKGISPLMMAIYSADDTLFDFLLEAKADVTLRTNPGGMNALCFAARYGEKRNAGIRALRLLKQGADPNTLCSAEDTALHKAAGGCAIDVASVLIKNGAYVDATNEFGMTPLIEAVVYDCFSAVKVLVEHKAQVNYRNRDGVTAMSIAESLKHWKIVKYLKANGGKK